VNSWNELVRKSSWHCRYYFLKICSRYIEIIGIAGDISFF